MALAGCGPERRASPPRAVTAVALDGAPADAIGTSVTLPLGGLEATETARGTVVSLPGDITFDEGQATIRPSARPTLDKLAMLIKARDPGTVAIEGHSDSRGPDAVNQRLSVARAMAVRDYLVEVRMVDGTKLTVRGYGKLRPAAPNRKPDGEDDSTGRARNRRVEVVLAG
ncbi:OmpA family protein [Sphingomonas sp.]|uniref:OmpA family protein n=1 Tax=Sphingomonas sp. TaxID=28214 RepID=UPI003AFFCE36